MPTDATRTLTVPKWNEHESDPYPYCPLCACGDTFNDYDEMFPGWTLDHLEHGGILLSPSVALLRALRAGIVSMQSSANDTD